MTDKPLKFPNDFDDHWGNLKVSMSKVQSAKRLLKQMINESPLFRANRGYIIQRIDACFQIDDDDYKGYTICPDGDDKDA